MDDKQRLAELLDQWEDALEQGHTLTPDDLCRDHPELLPALKQQIAALRAIDQRLRAQDKSRVVSETRDEEADDDTAESLGDSVEIHAQFKDPTFLARGGLGAVYVARDGTTNREVALKFIHPRLATDADSRTRFHQEAEVTALLEHPGIVPLYGVGETPGGRLFYAMRLVRGRTMESSIARYYEEHPIGADKDTPAGRLALRELLRSLQAVCHTVAYAHNRGVVHRDIKPQNVILGRYRETVVIDWGLATPVTRAPHFKASGEASLLLSSGSGTSSHGGAGTPPYMSPAQISELEPTPADDIYGLGVMLYKILTSRLPFQADTTQGIRELILKGKFDRPSTRNPRVAKPLEAICLKAMAFHPADRYTTATDLADDIERYMADEAVTAYPEPLVSRFRRWLRRHRGATISALIGAAAVGFVITITAGWLATMADREHRARVEAERLHSEAELARLVSLQTSARLGAKSVGQEIDRRWWILQSQANSVRLRELVTAINNDPANRDLWQPLQLWLTDRFLERQQAVRSTSWFVNAMDGTQVARCPRSQTIGENYAYRSYFTGRTTAMTPEEARGVPPHNKPVHMSGVFQSTNTGTLMLAFSVPIWDRSPDEPNRKSIGVLCMTAEIGYFELPEAAMLVDTREDFLQTEAHRGLVLHHDQLGHRSRDQSLPRIDDNLLERIDKLFKTKMAGRNDSDIVIDHFQDPVLPDRPATLAAVEPVLVAGRDEDDQGLFNTGWAIIVVDRPAD